MKNKGVMGLQEIGVAFISVGLIFAMGIFVMGEFGETTFSGELINESLTFAANDTYYWLNYKAKTVATVINYTHEFPSQTGTGNSVETNYSVIDVGQKSQIKMFSNETYTIGTYNVSYYALKEPGYLATANTTSGLYNISTWLPIVAVVTVAGVILALIGVAFSRREGF